LTAPSTPFHSIPFTSPSFSNSHFATSGIDAKAVAVSIAAVRAVRQRYGRLVKAETKVLELLGRGPENWTKLLPALEESAAKALIDVVKAKETREKILKKRALDAEEKMKKEAQKEILRLKKEELAVAEKKEKIADKEKEKEKKEKQPTEKELKQAVVLEKQRNVMLGFFNAAPSSSSSSSSSSTNQSKSTSSFATRVLTNRAALGGPVGASSHSVTISTTGQITIDLEDSVCMPSECVEDTQRVIVERKFDIAAFEAAIKSDSKITMGDISEGFRGR
jgi:hypothetical protein